MPFYLLLFIFPLLLYGNFVLKFVEKRVVYGDLEQKGKRREKHEKERVG